MCRIAGVPVQFHSTALIFPTGYMLWEGRSDDGWRICWPVIALVALFWLSLLVHEFAHIFAAKGFGIGTRKMIFIPVGAVALVEEIPRTAAEGWIAVAGPLGSLAFAGICKLGFWAMCHWMNHWTHGWRFQFLREHFWIYDTVRMLRIGCLLNLVLALFNLLPCYPMDGGRILRSALAVALKKFTQRSRERAFLAATVITVRWVSWPLALGAMVFTIVSIHDWTELVLFPLLLFVGEVEVSELRAECRERDSVSVLLNRFSLESPRLGDQ